MRTSIIGVEMKSSNQISVISIILSLVIIFTTDLFSQEKKAQELHRETIDQNYVPRLLKNQSTSPAFTYSSDIVFVTQVNVDENGDNIISDAANEPSIAFQ